MTSVAAAQVPAPGKLNLDHVAHFVPHIDSSSAALEQLGFTLTPFSAQSHRLEPGGPVIPAGAGNRCVMLKQGDLEFQTSLFCTRSGQPYTASGFDSIWQRAMRKATDPEKGVLKDRFTEHDIRANTATDDPLNVQQWLGQKTRAMTDRYVKVRKVEKVKPLARKI